MKTVTITADRTAIFDQVARTTGYAGAKQIDRDEHAYERISTTKADEDLLAQFWHESRGCLCHALRRLIEAEGMEGEIYRLDLTLSEAFDEGLLPSVATDLDTYFVNDITSKWLALVDMDSATDYATAASRIIAEIQRKLLCKRPPKRPTY